MRGLETELEAATKVHGNATVRTAVAGVGDMRAESWHGCCWRTRGWPGPSRSFWARGRQRCGKQRSAGAVAPAVGAGEGKLQPEVRAFSWELIRDAGTEIVFLALPHETSRQWPGVAGAWGARDRPERRVALDDPANRAVYKLHDADAALAEKLQAEAVFGAPELHREAIAAARLVANPGCYATSIILALAPLLRAGWWIWITGSCAMRRAA